jgi:DNA polymerase elongation subunit (family B)
MAAAFTQRILKPGRYLQFEISNCDLKHEQVYFYNRDVFPLAFVQIESENDYLKYTLLDSAESINYTIPPLRILKTNVEIAKQGKIAKISDPIDAIAVNQDAKRVEINHGNEAEKLVQFVQAIRDFDPDIIVTKGGDSHLFPYLVRRAVINGAVENLVLGRDNVPLVAKNIRGRTFFLYGRTLYRAPMRRLYSRIHVDERNTFIISESGLDGLYEIARLCRGSLHTAARSSIGSSMSSIE